MVAAENIRRVLGEAGLDSIEHFETKQNPGSRTSSQSKNAARKAKQKKPKESGWSSGTLKTGSNGNAGRGRAMDADRPRLSKFSTDYSRFDHIVDTD